MNTQDLYQKAIKFAALKHTQKNQTIPGTILPYVVHVSNVAMEILIASKYPENFDLDFAVQVALLHDVLEDTDTTFDELSREFGEAITNAVAALTKNDSLPKHEKMQDSLYRIKKLQQEVGAVKLADRITNMQIPPAHWTNEKRNSYKAEAEQIVEALKGSNIYLENRLREKIIQYDDYIMSA
jgi:guanosine-3',5'-bis(diphosphate) 3'-pyrophosphohydrolase